MPNANLSKTDRVLQIARQRGVLRGRDLEQEGLSSRYLRRLAERGELKRVGRGLYRHPEAPLTEHHSFALVAARYPDAVVCLLSALQFHELTSQWPRKVWIAREKGRSKPEASPAQLEVAFMSGGGFIEGIQSVDVEGISVRIYEPAKTVADCFKFRGRIGLEVAIEALRSYVRTGTGPIDDLYHFADVCQVRTVMRPYIEATV